MHANAALMLNADFRPLSYFPLSLISWRDAVQAIFAEKISDGGAADADGPGTARRETGVPAELSA